MLSLFQLRFLRIEHGPRLTKAPYTFQLKYLYILKHFYMLCPCLKHPELVGSGSGYVPI